jgi:hypothetical protein
VCRRCSKQASPPSGNVRLAKKVNEVVPFRSLPLQRLLFFRPYRRTKFSALGSNPEFGCLWFPKLGRILLKLRGSASCSGSYNDVQRSGVLLVRAYRLP